MTPRSAAGTVPDGSLASAVPAHFPALDGLRALAILLVIPHNEDIFSHATGMMIPVALLAHAGWIGVQLFFVLSGFLITGNLIDSQRADNYYSAFYARRVLRIFPLYYGTLIVALLLLPALVTLSPGVLASYHNQIWYWTFLSNWVEPYHREVAGFSHFWSLAVEEQFYLLWPLIVHRLSLRRIVMLGGVLTLVALVIRSALVGSGAPPEAAYMFTMCRMDALALGAAGAALVRMPNAAAWLTANRRRLAFAALGTTLIAAACTHEFDAFHWTTLTYGQLLLSVAFTLFILFGATARRERPKDWVTAALSSAPMRSIGRYSYAMYVLHLPLSLVIYKEWFAPLGAFASLAYVLSIIVLSYLAGAASYHLLEKHFLRLKRWFVPRARQPTGLASPDAATTS